MTRGVWTALVAGMALSWPASGRDGEIAKIREEIKR
jgi:hypothetical protein